MKITQKKRQSRGRDERQNTKRLEDFLKQKP